MKFFYLCLFLGFLSNSHAAGIPTDPEVVSSVDVQKYAGLWYEIGRLPNFFQNNCKNSTAEYGLLPSGEISVFNICNLKTGGTSTIRGKAFIPNPKEPAKLKVDFGFPRLGDYWIIDLDENYQWALVSGPRKESLFILARSAPMAPALLNELVERLRIKGFDTSKIVFDEY